MNKYIWADYHRSTGFPVIKSIIARNYNEALEKIAEMYENEIDEELPFDDWDTLADSLEDFDISLGDKLLDIEEC